MEHNEHLDSKQNCSYDENDLEGPAFFSFRRGHSKDLTGSSPTKISSTTVVCRDSVGWGEISLGLWNNSGFGNMREVERLCEDFMIIDIREEICLELLLISWIAFIFQFFLYLKSKYILWCWCAIWERSRHRWLIECSLGERLCCRVASRCGPTITETLPCRIHLGHRLLRIAYPWPCWSRITVRLRFRSNRDSGRTLQSYWTGTWGA